VPDAWQRIVAHTPLSKNEVENQIIWNNKFVTIAGKSVFYQSWYEARVKYIKDLITEDGNLMTLTSCSIGINCFWLVGLVALGFFVFYWCKTVFGWFG